MNKMLKIKEIKYLILYGTVSVRLGYGSGTVIISGSDSGSLRSVIKLRFRLRYTISRAIALW